MQVLYMTACPRELIAVSVARTALLARKRIDSELVEAVPSMRFFYGEPLSYSIPWATDEHAPLLVKAVRARPEWDRVATSVPVISGDDVLISWLRGDAGQITRERMMAIAMMAAASFPEYRNFRVPTGN